MGKTLEEFRFALLNAEGMVKVETIEQSDRPTFRPAPLRVAVYDAPNSPAFFADVEAFSLYPFRPGESGEVVFRVNLPAGWTLARSGKPEGDTDAKEQPAQKTPEEIFAAVPKKVAGHRSEGSGV